MTTQETMGGAGDVRVDSEWVSKRRGEEHRRLTITGVKGDRVTVLRNGKWMGRRSLSLATLLKDYRAITRGSRRTKCG